MVDKNELNINRITVIGELVEVDMKTGTASNGKDYVAGDMILKSVIKGKEQLTSVGFFAFATTKEGKENKFYNTYSRLSEMEGDRLKVDGEIEENRFYGSKNDEIVSVNRNRAKFINAAKREEEDEVSFEFGGYVVSPLKERLNKDDEIINYEIVLGQKDYSGDKPIYVKFAVDPDKEKAIEYMQENYEVGTTVKVNGSVVVVTEEVTKTEETAFGEDNVKTYVNTFRNYYIENGSQPIEGENEYSHDKIRELAKTYKEIGKSLKEKNQDDSKTSKSNKKKGSKSELQDLM